MEKSSEYLKMSDRFNLSHRFASYVIETSIEMDRPDIVYKAQQIHGLSYVRAGYIKPEALTEDGRVVPELDSSRGDGGNKVVVKYLLARRNDKTIDGAGASVRLIDVTESGEISDLPTCKYFRNSSTDIAGYVNELIKSSKEDISIREIAALSNTSFADDKGSYELMRAIMQNSLIKKDSIGLSEMYLTSLTEKSLRPVIRLAGYKAVQIIGPPVKIYADDPRQEEVYLTPVLLNPGNAINGLIEEFRCAKTKFEAASLRRKILFLSDGLNDVLAADYAL